MSYFVRKWCQCSRPHRYTCRCWYRWYMSHHFGKVYWRSCWLLHNNNETTATTYCKVYTAVACITQYAYCCYKLCQCTQQHKRTCTCWQRCYKSRHWHKERLHSCWSLNIIDNNIHKIKTFNTLSDWNKINNKKDAIPALHTVLVYPAKQEHVNWLTALLQVPPFWHGVLAQLLITICYNDITTKQVV